MSNETKQPQTESLAAVGSSDMVLRWTPEQRDKAMGIVNDIAEDIDSGETRKELREALAIYADMLCDTLQNRAAQKSDALLEEMKRLITLLDNNPALFSQNDQAHAQPR
jgi:hypothetical protein